MTDDIRYIALQRVVERSPDARWSSPEGDATRPVNTEATARPVGVVTCRTAEGWAQILAAAHDEAIPLVVRGGGWSPAGLGVAQDTIVLSMAEMTGVSLDGLFPGQWS